MELSAGRLRKITGFDAGVTSFDYADAGAGAGALRGVTCANGLRLTHEYDAQLRLAAVKVGDTNRLRLEYDGKNRLIAYTLEPAASGSSR